MFFGAVRKESVSYFQWMQFLQTQIDLLHRQQFDELGFHLLEQSR
jgi:hypothetical protein